MWDQAATKLAGGQHGLDPEIVERVQRERLFDAMARTVAEFGYQDTTVRRLLDRARISRLTYYELFKDKEDCFLAAYDEAVGHALERMREACAAAAGAPPDEQLRAGVQALLDFLAEEPAVARMCVVEVLAARPEGRARRAATMDELADAMERFLEQLRPDRYLGPIAARALVGGAEEVVYAAVERGETAELPELAAEIVETQLALVMAGQPEAGRP
jgi:AcrR family transcriptional regulator